MVLLIILVLLTALVIFLLVSPIILLVDTDNNIYSLHYKGIANAIVLSDEQEIIKIRFNMFFFKHDFFPLKKRLRSKTKTTQKKVKPKSSNSSKHLRTGLRILRTFKVKQFYLDLDTGDCITNAKLYPVFALLNFYVGNFNINFNGRNAMLLEIENKPIRIIRSYINI